MSSSTMFPWSVEQFLSNGTEEIGNKIEISDVQAAASYNWVARTTVELKPTIIVPGIPRILKRINYPFLVQADSGDEYVEQNCVSFSQSPMLPLFLSVRLMNPEFSFEGMDVITDKSVLRNILRWIQNSEFARDFDIEAELLGNKTLVLFQPDSVKPYRPGLFRKNVELAHTTVPSGWENADGHYRVVSYKLGNLKMLVRSPVDVCDLDDSAKASVIQNLSTQDLATLGQSGSQDGLNYIHHSGPVLPQTAISEFMVRYIRNNVPWKDVWHQLYFSGTNKLFLVQNVGEVLRGCQTYSITRTRELSQNLENSRKDLKCLENLLETMVTYLASAERNNDKLRLQFRKGEREIHSEWLTTPSNVPDTFR